MKSSELRRDRIHIQASRFPLPVVWGKAESESREPRDQVTSMVQVRDGGSSSGLVAVEAERSKWLQDNNKSWRGCGERGTLRRSWWG